MFKKEAAASKAGVDTVIGKAIHLESVTLKGLGNVRIDGNVTGLVELEGHLIISPEGRLEGDIRAAGATISGYCKGEIEISGTLHITSGAKIIGRIQAGKLIIDEGASITAACFANAEKMPADSYYLKKEEGMLELFA
ncbi:MAG: polymer-forming cytoskeletal protein [Oscillospiraceae bacterium]|nr:polymer-forming cytoskeletal protein [Oscillospiraceae bacterium]